MVMDVCDADSMFSSAIPTRRLKYILNTDQMEFHNDPDS
jgi:hypothetical protein